MKKLIFIICIFIGAAVSTFPQNLNGRVSSSYYTFQRFDTASSYSTHLRAFQMLNLNYNQGNFSVRTYLNLEHDISKPQLTDPRLRLYNLYIEGRQIFKVFTVKLGRQPLFNSVAGGIFDGINVDIRKGAYKVTAYYGANVPAYQKFEINKYWAEDFIAGGKFMTSAIENTNITLSYVNKHFRSQDYWAQRMDENLNPITVLIRNNSTQYEFANAMVDYNLEKIFSVDTRYDFDLKYKKTSRFEISGTYKQLKDVHFNFYYNYRAPLIRYNSIFSVFDYGNTQEYEIGADYFVSNAAWFSMRYGYVEYRDDNSSRITVGLNTDYGTLSFRKTFGYEGELASISAYTARTILDGTLTPSVGISYTNYQLSTDSETNHLTTLLAGINYRPMRILSFDLQGQYMDNKIYRNDFRLFFKVNYWFNTNF